MSLSRKDFEIFLYKNKFNQKSLMDIASSLSSKTIASIVNDLQQEQQPLENDANSIYVFTDGGCSKNGKADSKAGYSVLFSTDEDSTLYEFNTTRLVVKEPTNNKAELSAIRYVFKTVLENINLFENKTVIICTDSMYSINCIEKWSKGWVKNNWKNAKGEDVKNQDIIKSTLNLKDNITSSNKNIQIHFNHVFSHTQQPSDTTSLKYFLWNGNNIVDENIKKILNL